MNRIAGFFAVAALICCGIAPVLNADDAPDSNNLLKKWYIYTKSTSTVIGDDGVIACDNKTAKDVSGVSQAVTLNQTEVKPLTFSAESKAEDVIGDASSTYSIYLDIYHTDGTKTYGIVELFNPGTHDWEKVSKTYVPTKPVKQLTCLLLFRWRTGKVWFRNAVLTQDEPKAVEAK
ncbi:MAG: hypothetical protein WC071_01285 [Victivallaceae bacterium]